MKNCVLFCIITLFITISAEEKSKFSPSKLINRLYSKYAPVYEKYSGVLSKRRIEKKAYDPDTDKLLYTEKTILMRKNYFYEPPAVKALSYVVDGEKKDPDSYNSEETAPFYPVFGPKEKKNYKLVYKGEKIAEGKECYHFKVIPLKKGFRYFSGNVYITQKNERLLLQEGVASKMHWAVKEFYIRYIFEDLPGNIPALKKGKVRARVYVFLIRPDRRFVYNLEVLSNKPLKKKDAS